MKIQEIGIHALQEFWNKHIRYLVEDNILRDIEKKEYFEGDAYRGILKVHMLRNGDIHPMIHFLDEGMNMGSAQYCAYLRENGKCSVLDFWIYRKFCGEGRGLRCFQALESYRRQQGALYYELNSQGERRVAFWKSLGFVEKGDGGWNVPLWEKRILGEIGGINANLKTM